jgi:hypothetical protein
MRRKISIVVPFFNEEDNVTRLLAEIRAVCDALGQSMRRSSSTTEAMTLQGNGSTKRQMAGPKPSPSISYRITVRARHSSLV